MSEERTNISDGGKLLTVKEYAQRYGYAERTVVGWCGHHLLPGATKEKSTGGVSRYRYMIPENAVPERMTLAQAEGKPDMLTSKEYASLTGRNPKTVIHWCEKGMLDGVERVKRGTRFYYLIPKEAQPRHMQKTVEKEKPPEQEPQANQRDGVEMLSAAEYARRHGVKRNTVAHQCRNGALAGVIKIPAVRGGYRRYNYLIPADAKPVRRVADIEKEPGMMTTSEYAQKLGVKTSRVLKWCEKGQLEGIRKVPCGTGYRYLIPEDAEPEKRIYPKVRKAPPPKPEPPKPPEPTKPKKVWTEREISLHIMRYCGTRTYRQLAEELEMSVEEVRRRYERLHRIHGI